MKILHIFKSFYPDTLGGVEKLIEGLSSNLAGLGIQSAVMTTTNQQYQYEGMYDNGRVKIPVYYFPKTFEISSCPFSFQMLKNFKKIAEQFDILHYHYPWPFGDLLYLLGGVKKPVVVTYHSDIVKQKILKIVYTPIMNRFLKKVDYIVATSNNYVKTSPVLKKFQEKIRVIPLGVDLSLYPLPSDAQLHGWKNKLGEGFFLFVGVLRYYKGLEFLLAAVRSIDMKVVIAGKGPEEEKLKLIAQKHQLHHVIFVGEVEEVDKAALYQLCRAVVVPSHLRSEAFSITLLEGLMFGKPLISTEIGTGTSFVNQHQVSGLVVPPENPEALRHAMQMLLNDDLCRKLGIQAKNRYIEYFTGAMMAEKYKQLYQELVK